jgi:ankyrin repeat protein
MRGFIGAVMAIMHMAKMPSKMINAQDFDGWTALHHAAFNNCGDVVLTLLKAGALVTVADVHKQTPRMHAEQCGNNDIAAVLAAVEKDPGQSLDSINLLSKRQIDAERKTADLATLAAAEALKHFDKNSVTVEADLRLFMPMIPEQKS